MRANFAPEASRMAQNTCSSLVCLSAPVMKSVFLVLYVASLHLTNEVGSGGNTGTGIIPKGIYNALELKCWKEEKKHTYKKASDERNNEIERWGIN